MDDLFTIHTIKEIPQRQIRRPVEGIIEEWAKDISKEMLIVQNKFAIHG